MNGCQRLAGALALSTVACSSEAPARRSEPVVASALPPAASSVKPVVSAPTVEPSSVTSAAVAAPSSSAVASTVGWRPLAANEPSSKALEAGVVFQADATNAYWVSNDRLLVRPLAGGPARALEGLARVRSGLAVVDGKVLVEGSDGPKSPIQQWLVSLDGSSPPRDGGERGISFAEEEGKLWIAGLDAIWRFDAPDHKLKSRDNHEAFTLDADAFYYRDQARKIIALDRKRGTPRVLATDAWSDVALDGADVLWIKPDPESADATSVPSHRTIERTPKKGGKARAIVSADEPCGLWIVDDWIYFFGQGPRYETTALYRAPRAGAKEAEKVADTPLVSTFFGCRDAARVVEHTLYWASKSGWLLRSDLSAPHPVIEALPAEGAR